MICKRLKDSNRLLKFGRNGKQKNQLVLEANSRSVLWEKGGLRKEKKVGWTGQGKSKRGRKTAM